MATSIADLSVMLSASTAGLNAGLRGAQSALSGFAGRVNRMGAALNPFGGLMGQAKSLAGTALALTGVGGLAFGLVKGATAGADFEASMSRVKALMRPTAEEFKALGEKAMEVGGQTEYTSGQVAKTMTTFAMAGFKTKEVLDAIMPAVQMASIGEIELAEAANAVVKIMRGSRIPISQTTEVIDILTRAISNSTTNIPELLDAFRYVGPIGKTAGKGIHEVTAGIMALSDAGISGEMAGTTMRGLLLAMSNQSEEGKKMLQDLGISFSTAEGKYKHFSDIVNELGAKLKGMGEFQQLEVLGTIFERRTAQGMAALINTGGAKLRELEGILKSGVTAGDTYKIMVDNVRGAWMRFTSALETTFTRVMQHWAPGFQRFFDSLAAGIAALQPVGEILSLMAQMAAKMTGLSAVGDWLANLTSDLQALTKATSDWFAWWIPIFRAELGAVSAAVQLLWRLFVSFLRDIGLVTGDFAKSWTKTWEDAKTGMITLFIMAEFGFKNFAKMWEIATLRSKLAWVVFWEELKHSFQVGIPAVFSQFTTWFVTGWQNALEAIGVGFQNFIGNVVNTAKNLPALIAGSITATELWKPLLEGFQAKAMPEIKLPAREAGAEEKALANRINRLTDRLAVGWEHFLAKRLKEIFAFEQAPPWKPIPEAAKPPAAQQAQQAQQAAEKAAEKAALKLPKALEYGSQEAGSAIVKHLAGRTFGKPQEQMAGDIKKIPPLLMKQIEEVKELRRDRAQAALAQIAKF